jgi:hypothetical protein
MKSLNHLLSVKDPIVGLEFLVFFDSDELVRSNTPNYHCSLCRKAGNCDNITKHLKSTAHLLSYLKLMMPAVLEEFNFHLFMNSKGATNKGMTGMIASEIEKKFHRKRPVVRHEVQNRWEICHSHFRELSSRRKPSREQQMNVINSILKRRTKLKQQMSGRRSTSRNLTNLKQVKKRNGRKQQQRDSDRSRTNSMSDGTGHDVVSSKPKGNSERTPE